MRERKENPPNDLPVYESHPPNWLPKAHISADLGYPGFHPPRPNQDEELLSDANIKNGYVLGQTVSAEHFSAQATANESLRSGDAMFKLEELMSQIFARKTSQVPAIPASTFKIPTRVTLNDAKRQAWFADLANPNVPLHKLGKNVPHGAKGHDLLDLLQSNNVAIPRAVWVLRVLGANETAGLRNKPSYNPTHYSIEWTNVFTSYMKKQLAEVTLPSAPRPGLNIKQSFKGVLADAESRQRWISRFVFCLQLLRTFYEEGLVDRKTFIVWLVHQMISCNLAQAGFVARIAEEYLHGMTISRALTAPFIEASLGKLSEIRASSAQEYLVATDQLLSSILQSLCFAVPDALVNPRTWMMHGPLLTKLLSDGVKDNYTQIWTDGDQQRLLDILMDIKDRNDCMLFRHLPSLVTAKLGTAVSNIELLNSISQDTDMSTVAFFPATPDASSGFSEKMDLLLTWAVTPLQFGDHRPFAAVTLVRFWRDRARERANRRECKLPDEFLQDHLFTWLDSSEIAGEPGNLRAVAVLFGKLVKQELFSYAHYVQRLIARGEPGLSLIDGPESRHSKFLQWIPLFNTGPDLNSQRRLTLYGTRAREVPEDANEREIRREIRTILPEMFEGACLSPPVSKPALLEKCPLFVSASRYEQVRTIRKWLLPILKKKIASRDIGLEQQPVILRCYCVAVELMAHVQCHYSILDLTLAVLEHTATVDLLAAVVGSLHRFATIWACMDAMRAIVKGLYGAHQLWKARGVRSRPLLSLLVEFDRGLYLDETDREMVLTDNSAFSLALHPTTRKLDVVPDVLPEILLMAGDHTEDAPSSLASALWIKYRGSLDWGWKVWDNTVASLRQIPAMTDDKSQRRACALRYGKFLYHVDQHLSSGLDDQVLDWFLGRGKNEISALSPDTWDIFTAVLLYLSVHGALKTTTIFTGLVYPTWRIGASLSGERSESYEVLVRAANNLFKHLLLLDHGSNDDMPPTNLLDVQCIQTSRQSVYSRSHFPDLVATIPVLVTLENHELISEDIRDDLACMRQNLCENVAFRRAVFQNLDAIRDAFDSPEQLSSRSGKDVGKCIVVALRMVLGEVEEIEPLNWPDATSLLSPWKISATAVQLQFVLRQLGKSDDAEASMALDNLSAKIFRNTLSSEEAYFVAKMTKGAGNPIAGKFINTGLKCVTDILRDLPLGVDQASDRAASLTRAGEVLRVLIYVAEPLRDGPMPLPLIEPEIQDRILNILRAKFQDIESFTSPDDPVPLTQGAILLCRFLQFNLGFRRDWTTQGIEDGRSLATIMFRLILSHATGVDLGLQAYPVLMDTLYFLLDELPTDSKSGVYDPFRHYPTLSTSDLPADLPAEYRRQLVSLMPYRCSVSAVADLAVAHKDSSGNLVHDFMVVNRPWEWIENLGEPAQPDPKDEDRDREERQRLKTRHLVKNNGSLSLDTFGARMTGDAVLQGLTDDDESSKVVGNIRSFEDSLSSETVFVRDWRETRVVELDALISGKREPNHDGFFLPQSPIKPDRRTPRGSPVSTPGVSRSSTHGSSKSIRPSPGQSSSGYHRHSTSTTGEGDGSTSGSSKKLGSKRKAKDDSDDEIMIVDGPSGPPKAKKQKAGKAPAKTKTRKR